MPPPGAAGKDNAACHRPGSLVGGRACGAWPRASPTVAILVSQGTRGTGVPAKRLGQLPSIALAAQDEDFRMVNKPVGDGGGHGG